MTDKSDWQEEFDEVWRDAGNEYPNRKARVVSFIAKTRKDALEEYRAFILNVLDGTDIADKEMGHDSSTKAIRLAIQSRSIDV